MSTTESKDGCLIVHGLLDTLECLVNIRDKFPGNCSNVAKTIETCIVHTAERLKELDVNTSEFNAFEELERLAAMEEKIKLQEQMSDVRCQICKRAWQPKHLRKRNQLEDRLHQEGLFPSTQ